VPVRSIAPPAPPRLAGLLCAAALAGAALGGCGGSARSAGTGGRGPSGQAVFARACQSCHSLSGQSSARQQGGDLLHFRSSRAQLTQFTREMPERRPLTAAELRAVVDYLRTVEQGG
jgi:mono/diheme cytochrome c family protein